MNLNEIEIEIGSKYWTVYHNDKINFIQILEAVWKNDRIDLLRFKEGRVFSSKKDAQNWLESK